MMLLKRGGRGVEEGKGSKENLSSKQFRTELEDVNACLSGGYCKKVDLALTRSRKFLFDWVKLFLHSQKQHGLRAKLPRDSKVSTKEIVAFS